MPTSPRTPKTLKWFGWTDRGKVRSNNEDAFIGFRFDAREIECLGRIGDAPLDNKDFAFAVSDGMGGALAGEYASKIAVEKITTLLPRSFQHSALGLAAGFGDLLSELFGQIHRALAYLGSSYEECHGMEATLSLCWITPQWLYFGHIGDSRLYYLPAKGGIKQLSQDDTHVGWLFRKGEINEREARTHPRRSVLQKALGGSNQFVDPQVGAVGYEVGDRFLLCTDGLIEGLYDNQLTEILGPAKKKRGVKKPGSDENPARQLVEASLENGGHDNVTAIVIEIA